MANEQRGYIFHSGNNWYVRYRDNIVGAGGSVERKQICRKIEGVEYPAYKTKSSVRPYVTDLLAPINSGMVNAQSAMPITAFNDGSSFLFVSQKGSAMLPTTATALFVKYCQLASEDRIRDGKAPIAAGTLKFSNILGALTW